MAHASVDDLLDAVTRLSPDERDDFAFRFADQQWEAVDDQVLIRASRRRLNGRDEARLRSLIAKSERSRLAEHEQAEYRQLAQQAERINVHRIQALAELVRRRGQPIQVVMKEVGWDANVHGA